MKISKIEIVNDETYDFGDVESVFPQSESVIDGVIVRNENDYNMPDIDYDVSDSMGLKEYLASKWGDNCVVPVSNWNTLQLRSLIKDISKFYNISFQEVNEVTNVMLKEATPIAKRVHGIKSGVYTPTFEELKQYSDTLKAFLAKYPHIATHINRLHGQISNLSRHAGGVLICEQLDNKMPLISSKGVRQTPWMEGQTVRHLEPFGFVKFDLLGLSTLRMFETAIRQILIRRCGIANPTFADIKKWYNENLHPNVIDFDDKEVYKNVFHDGKFVGVFQFAESGMQNFALQAKPTSLDDIAAITAIYRPGPLSANVDKMYVEAVRDPGSIDFEHPIIEDVTKNTFGFLIYQEQIAELAHRLGKNISMDEGNQLRKVLTKKGTGKEEAVKNSLHDRFVAGCLEKGLTDKQAEAIWKKFIFFAGYGFNKCLSGDTLVETRSGRKYIKDVQVGEKVLSKNGYVTVLDKMEQGRKQTYIVTLTNGMQICCTLDHKFETTVGMMPLIEILQDPNYGIYTNDEKGYTGLLSVAVSKYEETYDIEVDHSDHTFFGNGISVSNSHSYGYSMTTYQCAFLLTHYTAEWAAAYLAEKTNKDIEDSEKAISLVGGLGFDIGSVDVNKSSNDWEIINETTLVQPLSTIKGLGETALKQIIDNRPFHKIEDMIFNENIVYSKLNKKAFESLTKSGALDNLIDSRFSNLKHFWKVVVDERPKSEKLFQAAIDKYKDIEDFTNDEKIHFISELTGQYPINRVAPRSMLKKMNNLAVPAISQYDDLLKVVWAIPKRIETKTTQTGKTYLIVTVTDSSLTETKVRCWISDPNETLALNKVYMLKPTYDQDWGFSTRGYLKTTWKPCS